MPVIVLSDKQLFSVMSSKSTLTLKLRNTAMLKSFTVYNDSLESLPDKQLLITTINAYSYNLACKDADFAEALTHSDVLLPDGISIVLAKKWLAHKLFLNLPILLKYLLKIKGKAVNKNLWKADWKHPTIKKIAGADLFYYEMNRLDNRIKNQETGQKNIEKAKAMFLGSTDSVLKKIQVRAGVEFPNVKVYTYSPPYKEEFTEGDNAAIFDTINAVHPEVLFVGMTAPKQEKWAYKLVHSRQLTVEIVENKEIADGLKSEVGSVENETANYNLQQTTYNKVLTTNYLLPANCHVCCIGAVFDYYAGTVKRAPQWMIRIGMEWLCRLVKEPKRMWRRYLIGNLKFIGYIIKEKLSSY